LADILHHELARSGEADVAEGAARQRDLQIAPGRPSVAVEHETTASHFDMGDEVGRPTHDDLAALAAAEGDGAGQRQLDRIAVVPRQATDRRAAFRNLAARRARSEVEGQAMQVAAAERIGERQRGNADAEAADGDPTQGSHVTLLRLPALLCRA